MCPWQGRHRNEAHQWWTQWLFWRLRAKAWKKRKKNRWEALMHVAGVQIPLFVSSRTHLKVVGDFVLPASTVEPVCTCILVLGIFWLYKKAVSPCYKINSSDMQLPGDGIFDPPVESSNISSKLIRRDWLIEPIRVGIVKYLCCLFPAW